MLATALKKPQQIAKELDRSKQMLIAARILTHQSSFLVKKQGNYVPAKLDRKTNVLIQTSTSKKASRSEILQVYQNRIKPILTDNEGAVFTFEEKGIDLNTYLKDHKKTGYAHLPLKLLYAILPNSQTESDPIGYVIPVNGFGLWDAIYGYIAIENNGDTVIGITWYQQSETAGLGAEISTPDWQKQFHGKDIFQPSADGQTNYKRAPIGIQVIKGRVSEVLGTSPKAKSAVDGISGASSTGDGVTNAYRDSLEPYRPFLLNIREQGTADS